MTNEILDEKKLSGFMSLAEQSVQSGNHEEAISFYTKALEINPTHSEAWFGKAVASGWLSTLEHLRLLELTNGIKNAIKYCPEDRQEEMRLRGTIAIHTACNSVYRAAYSFFQKNTTFANGKYVVKLLMEVLNALEFASTLNPKSIQVMESLIVFSHNACAISGGASEDKDRARATKLKYEALVKNLDPNYKMPMSSGCFIVTATMGNDDNLFVTDLRFFRDAMLAKSKLGRAFISRYYKNGPLVAKFIEVNFLLRLISLALVVLPVYLVAKSLLILSKKK